MCVSLSVYVISCAFHSHLPKSLSLLTKEYRSESEVPVSLKERGRWVRERACLCWSINVLPAQVTFHQTPGNSQWSLLEVRLPLVSQSWTPCSCWWFWYSCSRERKAGLKNWSFSRVLHFPRFMCVSCRLCPRQQGISVPGAHTLQSGHLFCYRAI